MKKPMLSDSDLLAYLDGEAEPEVAAQIEQTPAYQARLAVLSGREAELKGRLAGIKRPFPLHLADYHLGLLSSTQANALEQYLAEHPHATHQLAELQQFLEPPHPPETAESSLLTHFKTLAATLFTPVLQPIGVRGSQEGVYRAGDYQVVLDSEPDPANASHRVVAGLLVGLDGGNWEATMWQTAQPPYSLTAVPLDEDGNFIIPHLLPGDYKLMLRNRQTAVQIYLQTAIP